MDKDRVTLSRILLWSFVAILLTLNGLLIPQTMNAYRDMRTELDATPTPTADVRSMLLVTFDPSRTPSPAPILFKPGSVGDEVARLQERLRELGYYSGEVDGQYGQGTAEAVTLFQKQHGLAADGVAGSLTLDAVYAVNAERFIPTPSPSPPPSLVKKGDRNDAVRALQGRLAELGFYTGALDGDFGSGTEQAVILFQEQHGLNADGIAGAETISLLESGLAQRIIPTATPDPAAVPLLVNKTYPVADGYRPVSLVNLRQNLPADLVRVMGSDIEGDPAAVAALRDMLEAAKAAGITGFQVSAGYRSIKYQQQLFDQSVNQYMNDGRSRQNAVSATRLTVADPGSSEHHTGLAFDFTVAGTSFRGTKQQIWLHEHCWEYGFIIRYQEDKEKITGFLAEAWHVRYVGRQHSIPMRDRNLCLEEYVGMLIN